MGPHFLFFLYCKDSASRCIAKSECPNVGWQQHLGPFCFEDECNALELHRKALKLKGFTTRTFARRTDRFANFAAGAKSAWHTSPFEDKKIKVFMAETKHKANIHTSTALNVLYN